MVNNSSNTLSIIRETVSKFVPDCKVFLFGSRARKDYSIDSDYDFLVITKDTIDIRRKRTLKSMIRKELAKFKIPVRKLPMPKFRKSVTNPLYNKRSKTLLIPPPSINDRPTICHNVRFLSAHNRISNASRVMAGSKDNKINLKGCLIFEPMLKNPPLFSL